MFTLQDLESYTKDSWVHSYTRPYSFARDTEDRKVSKSLGAFKILLCFPFIQMEDIDLDLNFQFCRTSSPLIPVSTSDLKIHLLVPESEV